jgi:DNA ligase-1
MKNIYTEQYFEPMLASKWEDSKDKITYPIFSQPKLDGIRCIVTKDGMFSRNGKPIISAPHIRESLSEVFEVYPELILDGELYADKFANDFNKIVSLVKKTKPTDADLKESKKNIQYWIYDLPNNSLNFGERCYTLDELFDTELESFEKHCVLVETDTCNNEDEVMELYGEYVDKGFEGQMLRLDKKYENKRSKALLKHKSFIDEEFTILDIVEGDGNRTGTAGYFVFENENGDRFKSNVKGTWQETAEMLKNKKKLIGKEATIKYFNRTPAGIPRFGYVINIDRNSYE